MTAGQIHLIKNLKYGVWAIEEDYADAILPLVADILSGSSVVGSREVKDFYSISRGNFKNENGSYSGSVGIIEMKGPIIKYDQKCGPTGTETIASQIVRFANDNSISAIVLDIDSPGGSADAVSGISAIIEEVRKKKPVIAYGGNGMVASAAYWIASYCDEIYMTFDSDRIGSIGTYLTIMDNREALQKIGFKVENIYATKSTEKNDAYRDYLKGDKTKLQAYVNEWNDMFLTAVKANRPNVKESALTGKLFNIKEALEMGLIEGKKTFQEAIDRAVELASINQNNMFGKKTAIQALVSANAEDRTEEMFAQAQAELQAAGLGVLLLDSAESVTKAISAINNSAKYQALEQQVTSALESANAYIEGDQPQSNINTAMTAVIEKAQSAPKIPVSSAGGDPQPADASDMEKALASLEHNKKADSQI